MLVDIVRDYIPLPRLVRERASPVYRHADQREHTDRCENRPSRARPDRIRQSEIKGGEIDQKWNHVGHEAWAERMPGPPNRCRTDDDRVSDDDRGKCDVQ